MEIEERSGKNRQITINLDLLYLFFGLRFGAVGASKATFSNVARECASPRRDGTRLRDDDQVKRGRPTGFPSFTTPSLPMGNFPEEREEEEEVFGRLRKRKELGICSRHVRTAFNDDDGLSLSLALCTYRRSS